MLTTLWPSVSLFSFRSSSSCMTMAVDDSAKPEPMIRATYQGRPNAATAAVSRVAQTTT